MEAAEAAGFEGVVFAITSACLEAGGGLAFEGLLSPGGVV